MPEWKIEVDTHVDTLEVCIWLQEQGFSVTRLEASKKLVADESNVLAAVEFALGMEGMSRDMRCEHCHKETVIPLSVPTHTVFVFIKFQSQANLAAYIDTLQGSTYTSQVMERSDTPISPWQY